MGMGVASISRLWKQQQRDPSLILVYRFPLEEGSHHKHPSAAQLTPNILLEPGWMLFSREPLDPKSLPGGLKLKIGS